MAAGARKSKPLETKLGYRFKDRALLDRALTHSSARTGRAQPLDNERLEFLGDRVLGLVIAELLLETLPQASEGELARRYNQLVRGETCAGVARDWEVGPSLILSESEAESGGRDKVNILADACEALLAAVFIEAGFARARDVIRKHWGERMPQATGAVDADAKSTLQEWAQGRGLELPVYREVGREGPDHAPTFTAEVQIGRQYVARGSGASKRSAEQDAATTLLVREGVWNARSRT